MSAVRSTAVYPLPDAVVVLGVMVSDVEVCACVTLNAAETLLRYEILRGEVRRRHVLPKPVIPGR